MNVQKITDTGIASLALALQGQHVRQFYVDLALKYYGPTAEKIVVAVSAHYNDEGYTAGLGDDDTPAIEVFDAQGTKLSILLGPGQDSDDARDNFYDMVNEIDTDKYPVMIDTGNYEAEAILTTFYVSSALKGTPYEGADLLVVRQDPA